MTSELAQKEQKGEEERTIFRLVREPADDEDIPDRPGHSNRNDGEIMKSFEHGSFLEPYWIGLPRDLVSSRMRFVTNMLCSLRNI